MALRHVRLGGPLAVKRATEALMGAVDVARSAGSQERVPGVPHQIVGVVEGEELATRSKLMRRAGI
jgi:hypothetical protein